MRQQIGTKPEEGMASFLDFESAIPALARDSIILDITSVKTLQKFNEFIMWELDIYDPKINSIRLTIPSLSTLCILRFDICIFECLSRRIEVCHGQWSRGRLTFQPLSDGNNMRIFKLSEKHDYQTLENLLQPLDHRDIISSHPLHPAPPVPTTSAKYQPRSISSSFCYMMVSKLASVFWGGAA